MVKTGRFQHNVWGIISCYQLVDMFNILTKLVPVRSSRAKVCELMFIFLDCLIVWLI
jgi:hypothetical protein